MNFRTYLEARQKFVDYRTVPHENRLIALDYVEEQGLAVQFAPNQAAKFMKGNIADDQLLDSRLRHVDVYASRGSFGNRRVSVYFEPALRAFCEFLHVNPRLHIQPFRFSGEDWLALVTPEMVERAAKESLAEKPELFQKPLRGRGYDTQRVHLTTHYWRFVQELLANLPNASVSSGWRGGMVFHEYGLYLVFRKLSALMSERYGTTINLPVPMRHV